MHGHISTVFFESHLQLFDKQPFAPDGGQAPILNAITFGRDRYEFDVDAGVGPTQQRGNMLGLPKRELTLSRCDPQRRGRRLAHLGCGGDSGYSSDFKR